MIRLIPTFVAASMLLGGAAVAQSFDPPSLPDLSGIPGGGIPQIDPPSLQIDVGPALNPDLFNPAFFNPDLFNPDIFGETDPGVALLELLAVIEEAVRSGLQQGRVLLDSDFGISPGEPQEDVEK